MIIQPAHPTPLNAAAVTQLQRDNIELQRQVHEHADTVLALRRDLAAANARLSDVTGIFFFLPRDARIVQTTVFLVRCLS